MNRKYKGAGCGCGASRSLGFPQTGGQENGMTGFSSNGGIFTEPKRRRSGMGNNGMGKTASRRRRRKMGNNGMGTISMGNSGMGTSGMGTSGMGNSGMGTSGMGNETKRRPTRMRGGNKLPMANSFVGGQGIMDTLRNTLNISSPPPSNETPLIAPTGPTTAYPSTRNVVTTPTSSTVATPIATNVATTPTSSTVATPIATNVATNVATPNISYGEQLPELNNVKAKTTGFLNSLAALNPFSSTEPEVTTGGRRTKRNKTKKSKKSKKSKSRR